MTPPTDAVQTNHARNVPCLVSFRRALRFVNLLDPGFLFASLIWGSIGVGFFIYGKKQQSFVPMIAGILMVAVSYFAASALAMSLICLGLISAVYVLLKRGY